MSRGRPLMDRWTGWTTLAARCTLVHHHARRPLHPRTSPRSPPAACAALRGLESTKSILSSPSRKPPPERSEREPCDVARARCTRVHHHGRRPLRVQRFAVWSPPSPSCPLRPGNRPPSAASANRVTWLAPARANDSRQPPAERHQSAVRTTRRDLRRGSSRAAARPCEASLRDASRCRRGCCADPGSAAAVTPCHRLRRPASRVARAARAAPTRRRRPG